MIGAAVFVSLFLLTQFLTYQQYLIYQRVELQKVSSEAIAISDKMKASLTHSLSATKTLAFLVENYGVPENFNSIAAAILESNKFIDAIELTREGVITHVYPFESNRQAIGYDILADSLTSREAVKALTRNQLYFAGPLELRQGGMAVVGRLPIYRDSAFWGFSAVLIRLNTLLVASGMDLDSDQFTYQISKRNPTTGEEEFFLKKLIPGREHSVSIEVPDGEWNLYVISKDRYSFVSQIFPVAFLGLLFSFSVGMYAWQLARQPERLKNQVLKIGSAMNALQKSSTESLQRVNRLYHFTSRINQLMVYIKDEKILYSEVCKIAFEIGKFKMAWIGLLSEDGQKIQEACSAGDEHGYLEAITPISIGSNDYDGPANKLVRTKSFVQCDDIHSDPIMGPWAERALAHGYKSLIMLPIKKFGEVIGSFTLYADEYAYFDNNEIKLLLETTNNISFTLENFEKENMRRRAEEQIQSEKMLSDSIINSLPGIFYLYDRNGKFYRWNKNFEVVSGYDTDEVGHMHPLDFFEGDDKLLLEKKIDEVFAVGYGEIVASFLRKDNVKIPFFFNGKMVNFDGVEFLIGMGLDVTDQVDAEIKLLERTEEIEKLSVHLQDIREEERSQISLEIHDVLGQQLTAIKMDAAWLKKRHANDVATVERVTIMMTLIDETIGTIRRISSQLRPAILDDLGLVAALEWQGAEFQKNTGIILEFKTNKSDVELDGIVATNIFRIFQEALTNVARHADATRVESVFIHEEDSIYLVINDNGKGIDLDEVKRNKSLGLISMKERARRLNGEVNVERILPKGTAVMLRISLLTNGTIT